MTTGMILMKCLLWMPFYWPIYSQTTLINVHNTLVLHMSSRTAVIHNLLCACPLVFRRDNGGLPLGRFRGGASVEVALSIDGIACAGNSCTETSVAASSTWSLLISFFTVFSPSIACDVCSIVPNNAQ